MGWDDIIGFVGVIFAIFIALFLFCILPIAWFEGQARSAWLKHEHSIDVPWYQAAGWPTKPSEIKAEIDLK